MNNHRVGEVDLGGQITKNDIPWHGEHIVEAKNRQGEIIFSQKFTLDTMKEIKRGKVYKVVIPPLEKGLESSDNITSDNITEDK